MKRRTFMKVNAAAAMTGSVALNAVQAFAAPKKPGEVRALFLVGDYWHPGMMQETHWRRVLGTTGWRLMFAQSSQFVTPEVLSQTDLFIFCRYSGPDSVGWSPLGIVEERPKAAPWMTSEQEDAIVENVTKRGMGIIPVHCSIWNPDNKKFMELIGVEKPIMHGPIRAMTSFYEMNPNHPITAGVEPFSEVDEIFGADMLNVKYEPLMRAKETNPDMDRLALWTREVGNGRVVMLNCCSTQEVCWKKSMKEIMWRSAYWAMKKDIPPSGLIEGREKDR